MIKNQSFIDDILCGAMIFKMFIATYLLFFYPSPIFIINLIVTICTFLPLIIFKLIKPDGLPILLIIISIIYDLIISTTISIKFGSQMQLLFMPMALTLLYQNVNVIWFKNKIISIILITHLLITPILYIFTYKLINYALFVYIAITFIGVAIAIYQSKLQNKSNKNKVFDLWI